MWQLLLYCLVQPRAALTLAGTRLHSLTLARTCSPVRWIAQSRTRSTRSHTNTCSRLLELLYIHSPLLICLLACTLSRSRRNSLTLARTRLQSRTRSNVRTLTSTCSRLLEIFYTRSLSLELAGTRSHSLALPLAGTLSNSLELAQTLMHPFALARTPQHSF